MVTLRTTLQKFVFDVSFLIHFGDERGALLSITHVNLVFRSLDKMIFRRRSTTEATNLKVSRPVINMSNWWRKFERAKERSPSILTAARCTEVQLSLPTLCMGILLLVLIEVKLTLRSKWLYQGPWTRERWRPRGFWSPIMMGCCGTHSVYWLIGMVPCQWFRRCFMGAKEQELFQC